MAQTNCMFGEDCPCHGRNCGCDMQWALLQDPESNMDWGIDIQENGQLKYYVFDTETFQEYAMCPFHFLRVWTLSEQGLFSIIDSGDRRVRLAPEE